MSCDNAAPAFCRTQRGSTSPLSATWRADFDDHWAGFVGLGASRLFDPAAGSPLVRQRNGAAFSLGFFRLGVDGRALLGSDVELDTIDSDLDNWQLTAFLGVGF